MVLLADHPVRGEPHDFIIFKRDLLQAQAGLRRSMTSRCGQGSQGVWRVPQRQEGHRQADLAGAGLQPARVQGQEGRRGHLILTNLDKIEDLTHGFAIPKYNVNFIVNPQETKSVTFVADKAGRVLVLLHALLPRAAPGDALAHDRRALTRREPGPPRAGRRRRVGWMPMTLFLRSLAIVVMALAGLVHVPAARAAGAYEAQLPDNLSTAPDLCALVPCREVLPGATQFSERKGQPPYVEAYAGEGSERRLLGYVMLSTDITDTPAYSGKPVVTLIGMDKRRALRRREGAQAQRAHPAAGHTRVGAGQVQRQYLGKGVRDKIEVGPSRPTENVLGVDAISGATVTVIAQNQVITTSANAVARQVGLVPPVVRNAARYAPVAGALDWAALVKAGVVQRLAVRPEQVGLQRASEPFIELWFGDLNHPDYGRALLGQRSWENLRERLKPHEHAVFIVRTGGAESFKGSGFVRGGLYDRIQVRQGDDAFTFRDLDYLNLYGLEAAGAPARTPSRHLHRPLQGVLGRLPVEAELPGQPRRSRHRPAQLRQLRCAYWLPAAAGRRPAQGREAPSAWQRMWKARAGEIALFALLLVAVTVVYALREKLTRRSTLPQQVAGQLVQVHRLGAEHRVRRLRRDGPALDHPGADLVPLAAVPVAPGSCSCPTRSSSCSGSSSSSPSSSMGGGCSAAGCARSGRCRRSSTRWRARWAWRAGSSSCRRCGTTG
jgi:transcriptional regulator of nitric oxide reductase